jgi:alpha-mannosidase
MSWAFTLEKIGARIKELEKAQVKQREPLAPLNLIRGDQSYGPAWNGKSTNTLSVGEVYKAVEETVTLTTALTVPDDWRGHRVFLALEFLGAETLVYVDGHPAQAIDKFHHELLLADPAEGGRSYEIALAAYTGTVDAQVQGGWSGAGDEVKTDDSVWVELRTAELQLIDRSAEALYYDMHVAFESAKVMDKNTREYVTIIDALDQTTNLLDFSHGVSSDIFYASVAAAHKYIQENLYQKYTADKDFAPTLWATGHAHIDTAWLWRLAHTHQKVARSFTNALALMDQYPDYHFSASQPQQYAYLKKDYPEIFERLKAAVARGQWEPVGAMWVESDCNVVSGESLVRQFLYGQRFFEREFGKRSNVVWLPDVFGYSAAFPQIIKKAGMKYFMTIKIYWNEVNKPPYQTFEWEGIDGTSVLTHFSPLGDYNAEMTPQEWHKNWNGYQQKHLNDSALYIFGYGDGGGGPTRQMIERGERAKDFPNTPKIKFTTNEAFFEDLELQVSDKKQLPRWVGELYLEHHRGTYTSQARNKQSNRRSEILLQTAEQIASLALLKTGAIYPHDDLTTAWELTLLNQFHDIIPGSSIHAVYEDSAEDYKQIFAAGKEAISKSLEALAGKVQGDPGSVILYNPLSWIRNDIAAVPKSLGISGQDVTDFDGNSATLISVSDLPSLGYDVIPVAQQAAPQTDSLIATENRLENKFFVVTFDSNGEISSVIDKLANREVIDQSAEFKGNALLTFEDKPARWDAWNIDIYYQDKVTHVTELDSIKVIEEGPLRATIEIKRTFGSGSKAVQRVSIYRDIARIDISSDIEWQERQTLLKAAFPVSVHSPKATYDIQFGNVERPTHWNTSWDWAQFEVCGHKWADLSEGDYGVSLLSDSRYGWDIKGNVMRLTLLKGAINPDPDADRGRHQFAYSLYPHAGTWRAANTVQRAHEFNVPIQYAALAESTNGQAKLDSKFSFASVNVSNIIIETVKKAEDDDALIVRFYETYGQRGPATITFASMIKSAEEVNLMEEVDKDLPGTIDVVDNTVTLDYRPYDIRTLKVRL